MYVQRNSETRSRKNCCRGKARSITYSECVSVALIVDYPACKAHAPYFRLSGRTIFFHIIS